MQAFKNAENKHSKRNVTGSEGNLSALYVIMIKNELCPLVFSHNLFRRPRGLFLLACPIRASVGSTYSLVHGIIFSSS